MEYGQEISTRGAAAPRRKGPLGRWAALGAALGVMVGALPARAQAPKAPEVKAPEVKAPEVKLPEMQVPAGQAEALAGPGLPEALTGLKPSAQDGLAAKEMDEGTLLTPQDLVKTEVTTASNRPESARDAPAWIITLTAQELRARGYQELTDLLDDLPGMDIIRPWGDTYFKSYWRGYRNEIGEPFLLLVDGMDFSHLWLGEAQIMAAIPLSNVERVEVAYGPASALYGPNAAMGVINVITRRKVEAGGKGSRASTSVRSPQGSLLKPVDMTKVADFSALYQGQGFRASVTGRIDMGALDPALRERFEWLKNTYLTDERLWGDFLEYEGLAGPFRSPIEKQAVDARLFLEQRNPEGRRVGETEVAAQHYRLLSGRGLIYPGDRRQARGTWTVLEQALSLRHRHELSSTLESSTLLRYRQSNIDNPTNSLRRDADSREVSFRHFQSLNNSFALAQGFNLRAGRHLALTGDTLQLSFGFQYEHRNLDNGTEVIASTWRPGQAPPNPRTFLPPPGPGDRPELRSKFDLWGAYLLSRYSFLGAHSLHLGFRLDYNTLFGGVEPTFRGGYVGHYLENLTVKLFYGQATQIPGWQELGVLTPEDAPERSGTVEMGLDYTLGPLVLHGGLYYAHFLRPAREQREQPQIFRQMSGAELGATALLPLPRIRQLRLWAYYSPYLLTQETNPQAPESLMQIGDLAWHKLLLGATLELNRWLSATALGRCISERRTVGTNPLGVIPGYCVADANLRVQDVFAEGLSLSLRVTNLLDTQYAHPGLYEADSGSFPGRWEEGRWIGSGGGYNSQLPQPGRAFTLQLGLEL